MSEQLDTLEAREDFRALHIHKTLNGFEASYRTAHKGRSWRTGHGKTITQALTHLVEQYRTAEMPRTLGQEEAAPVDTSAANDDIDDLV